MTMALKMLTVVLLSFCIIAIVAAQGNAPAPSQVIAPAPSPEQNSQIRYNYTWSRGEQDALKEIIEEWRKTNADFDSLLTGWSETELNPCENVWEGIVCTFELLNITFNNDGTQTHSYNISVVGLSISNTELTGILPPAIGGLPNLVYLVITGNPGLSGSIPGELSALETNLQILDLHDNNFNGSIPLEIGAIQNLNILDFSQNNLTGAIPSSVSNLTYLSLLQLSRNRLSGPIPGSNGDGLGLGNLSYLVSLDLMENDLTGGLPNFRNLPELQHVNVSHNQLSGAVILDSHFNVSAHRPLRFLDLSFNSFTGPIPNLSVLNKTLRHLHLSNNKFNSSGMPLWLSSFTELQTLGLANTSLTGDVPTFLFDTSLPNLTQLQLDRNKFEGQLSLSSFRVESTPLKTVNLTNNVITEVTDVTENLLSSKNVLFLLEGNPYCKSKLNMTREKYFFCRNSTDPVPVGSGNDRYRTAIIATSVTVSVTFLLVAVVAIYFCLRSRRERRLYYIQIQEEFAKKHVQPTLYAYSELRSATREFHPDMKLGQGAFGVVYKGVQSDGTELAVKDLSGQTSQQGLDEFLNEVVLITGVRHRNLVKLKGCCLKDDRRLLVYEYVENKNLAEVLFEGVGEHNLTWGVRYNMCLGVAQGLHYLHESAQPRIIHRDIKAPNILLDKNLHPKIADFGLARLFPDEESHITTLHVAGTMGYMAPEYASRGQLTEKADVYSFGVVILEIVSGRRNIEPKLAVEDIYLVELAWRLHDQGTLLEIVDPMMDITNDEEDVNRVLNVALLCVQSISQRRPSMARVVSMLKGEVEIEAVMRQLQFSRPEYDSFMAAAQSGSNFTMTTIAEKDEITAVEDEKPLLIVDPATSSASSSRPSSIVELSTIRPR